VSTNQPVQSNELKRAVIRKETFGSASTPQHSAAKVAKPQHIISVRTQAATADSTADANSALQSSASVHASTSRSAPTQAQVAQSQPPVSPPDTATPPAQQSTLADIVAVTMQASQSTGVMKTTGKVDLNGIFKNETALVYPNNKIVTPGQNGALVTAPGNAIALGANAQFTLSVTTTSITNNRSVR
jgi:hypothetical protein